MDNKILQSDSNVEYHSNLLSSLEQISSLVNKSISTVKAQLNNSSPNEPELPCRTCSRQTQNCSEHCEALNARLDGVNKGKVHGEKTGFDIDLIGSMKDSPDGASNGENIKKYDRSNLGNIKRVKALNILESYEKCWDRLTPKQREVVEFHGEGKKQNEIATILGKSCSTVCALLKSANKKKEDIEKELRAEQFKLTIERMKRENEF